MGHAHENFGELAYGMNLPLVSIIKDKNMETNQQSAEAADPMKLDLSYKQEEIPWKVVTNRKGRGARSLAVTVDGAGVGTFVGANNGNL